MMASLNLFIFENVFGLVVEPYVVWKAEEFEGEYEIPFSMTYGQCVDTAYDILWNSLPGSNFHDHFRLMKDVCNPFFYTSLWTECPSDSKSHPCNNPNFHMYWDLCVKTDDRNTCPGSPHHCDGSCPIILYPDRFECDPNKETCPGFPPSVYRAHGVPEEVLEDNYVNSNMDIQYNKTTTPTREIGNEDDTNTPKINQSTTTQENTKPTNRGGGNEDNTTNPPTSESTSQPDNTKCNPEIQTCPKIDIKHDVELVPQTSKNSCWAAGVAGVVGFEEKVCITDWEIPNALNYWEEYSEGLPPDDTTITKNWGLVPEPPQSYTVDEFGDLLNKHGPLWVATAEPGAHVRVVTGMTGDGTPEGTILHINDPSPPGKGSQYTETYKEFIEKQEKLASQEASIPGAVYLAHLP